MGRRRSTRSQRAASRRNLVKARAAQNRRRSGPTLSFAGLKGIARLGLILGAVFLVALLTSATRGIFLIVVAAAGALYWWRRRQRNAARAALLAQREERAQAEADEQRRRQKRDVERARHLGSLLMVSPAEFEHVIASLMRARGFDVQVVGGSRDLAPDITGRDPAGRSVVVQCKQYNPTRKVNSREMQQFLGMARVHHGADRCIYVTTARFTADAVALANEHDIELVDGDGLTAIAEQASSAEQAPSSRDRPPAHFRRSGSSDAVREPSLQPERPQQPP